MKEQMAVMLEPYAGAGIKRIGIVTTEYAAGGMAVLAMEGGQPCATISVWLPESQNLKPGSFYVKHWSENEVLVKNLIETGVLIPDPDAAPASSGFIKTIRAYRLVGVMPLPPRKERA